MTCLKTTPQQDNETLSDKCVGYTHVFNKVGSYQKAKRLLVFGGSKLRKFSHVINL